MIGVIIRVGGAVISASIAASFFGLDLAGVNPNVPWEVYALGSFALFVAVVSWGWIATELRLRGLLHASPRIVIQEIRKAAILYDDMAEQPRTPAYHIIQVWFRNDPKTHAPTAVARNVTAMISSGAIQCHGNWNVATDAAHVGGLGDVSQGHGAQGRGDLQQVDIDLGHVPMKLKLAIKFTDEEDCYIYATDSANLNDPRKALSPGEHEISIRLRGNNLAEKDAAY